MRTIRNNTLFAVVFTLILTLGLSLSFQLLAWTSPGDTPPDGNVSPPVYNDSGTKEHPIISTTLDVLDDFSAVNITADGGITATGNILADDLCLLDGVTCLSSGGGGGGATEWDHVADQDIILGENKIKRSDTVGGLSINENGDIVLDNDLITNAIYGRNSETQSDQIWIGDGDDKVMIEGDLCFNDDTDCISDWTGVGSVAGGLRTDCEDGDILEWDNTAKEWICGKMYAVYAP